MDRKALLVIIEHIEIIEYIGISGAHIVFEEISTLIYY